MSITESLNARSEGKSRYELETAVYEPSVKVREAIYKAKKASEPNRIPTTEVAKLIRLALKETFEGTKFSVKSHKYSMGSSIDIYWTDGPRSIEVKPIENFFRGAHFDGMIDLKSYVHTELYVGENIGTVAVEFGVDYVFGRREYSEEAKALAATISEDDELFRAEGIDVFYGLRDSEKEWTKLGHINFEGIV
tara:strand:- start:2060 stop:2638 length:579 start_codon:yes stop_codon:yes gene_type:complete